MRLLPEIEEALKDSGMSKAELSRRIGVHNSTMYRWFENHQQMPYAGLLKIIDVLGMTLEMKRK